MCSGNDDRQLGLFGFDARQQLDAVHARHPNIAHDHHRLFKREGVEHFVTALKGAAVEARPGQGFFHDPTDRAVVVDDPYLISDGHLKSPWVIEG